MSWRDNLKKATFRGVPFYVEDSSTGVGRRTEMHVYPLRRKKRNKTKQDYVWAQDLGAEPDSFRITGYVIQNKDNDWDYFEERDNLLKAFKTYGPGNLEHPFFKKVLKVSVDGKVEMIESITGEGGIARFSVNFVQYEKPIFSQLEKDFVEEIDLAALDLEFGILDWIFFVLEVGIGALSFVGSLVSCVLGAMDMVRGAINATLGVVASVTSKVLGTLSNFQSTASTVINAPCNLGNAIKDGTASVKDMVGITGDVIYGGSTGGCSGKKRGDVFTMDGTTIPDWIGIALTRNLAKYSDFGFTDLPDVPANQETNKQILAVSQQALMLGNATQVAIRTEFNSLDEMESLVADVSDAFENMLNRIGGIEGIDDTLIFLPATTLHAKFIKYMYAKNTGLAKELQYTVPTGVMSTLQLAYEQYEDVERCEEIFKRNIGNIKHPGFMPSGDTVQLLNE